MSLIDYCLRMPATLGPIGYLPASGTFATCVPLVFLLFFPCTGARWYLGFIVIVTLLGYLFIRYSEKYFIKNDPSEIVFDELIGGLVTFYAIPISWGSLLAGFVLFRFFDIVKYGPVRWAEHVHGAWGIILDDVVAGILSNIFLRLLLIWIFSFLE